MSQSKPTARQIQIKDLLDKGLSAVEVAEEVGISRPAVYQHIQRMRRTGMLDSNYTPTGVPVRELSPSPIPGRNALMQLLAGESSSADGAAAIIELQRVHEELTVIVERLSRTLQQ